MSDLVYRISDLLAQTLADVPVGTNLGLLHLQVALLSGQFLAARGAVFPALYGLGLAADAIHRASAALRTGCWNAGNLHSCWQKTVAKEGRFTPNVYEAIRPVACDLTAFFRPQLRGLSSKHYVSEAGKALPALVFGLCVAVGAVAGKRLGLPRLLLRRKAGESEAALQKRLIDAAAKTLAPQEALITDADFGLCALLATENLRFVTRVRKNQSARRNTLPAQRGKGRHPEYGESVRPLPRKRKNKVLEATAPDAACHWQDGRHRLRAQEGKNLVLPDQKPGAAVFRVVAIFANALQGTVAAGNEFDRLRPSVVASVSRPVSGGAAAPCRQADVRGPAFVRFRRGKPISPAGVGAACGQSPVLSCRDVGSCCHGFWDRAARPTCGRRRVLAKAHLSEFACAEGQLRKKNSVTAHLVTGVAAHRRTRAAKTPSRTAQAA